MRLAAFAWLKAQTSVRGDVLPRTLLQQGFEFQGHRIPLVSPQGIFKPQSMELPLSITTAPNGPYDAAFASNGLLAYRYRGTNRDHPDNVGLRKAMDRQVPLIYFYGEVRALVSLHGNRRQRSDLFPGCADGGCPSRHRRTACLS